MKDVCKRCGRDDLKVLSNGYCSRCDDAVFGYHEPFAYPPSHPMKLKKPGVIV